MGLTTSDRVTHWETHRGRNNEFDKTEAGTAIITLQNRDGLFDPMSLESEYQLEGHLLPLRQVTITAASPEFPTVYQPVFTGYIESWDYERRGPRHATATVHCVDGFELLNAAHVTITKNNKAGGMHFPQGEDVQDRINACLAFAHWPPERASIFSGNVSMQQFSYPAGSTMLQVIQDCAEAEFPGVANFYMDKAGRACFRGRHFRFDPFGETHDWDTAKSRAANLYKFGDDGALEEDPTLLPMANLTWTYGKERLYNWVNVIPAEMLPESWHLQTQSDSVLAQQYGKRDLTINGLLIREGTASSPVQTASQECRRFGRFYLQNYKHPQVRANTLEVHSKFEDDRIWDFLLNVEIGDVVELYTINPGGYGFGGEQFFVDGIHNVVDAVGDWPQWVSTYDLSPRNNFLYFPPPFGVGL